MILITMMIVTIIHDSNNNDNDNDIRMALNSGGEDCGGSQAHDFRCWGGFVILPTSGLLIGYRVSTEVTFGRGDLSVCPLWGFAGAHEQLISNWRGVPHWPPQGQTLRALLLRGTSVPH